jgi:putative ABC transport system permease protein
MPIRLVLLDDFQGQVRAGLLAVLAAVAFLLLIACSNLANLLLGRSLGRGQEIAVRMALGAGGSRLVRQLLTEAALLAAAGGLAGILLAAWATPLLLRLSPIRTSAFSSHLLNIAFDGRVLLFALAVTGATGVLFALAPALRVARADLGGYLKEKTARGSLSTGTRRLMDVSVVAQVALTLVLLTAAGIMIRSFGRLQRLEMGFQPAKTMTLEVNLAPGQYPDYAQRGIFVEQLLERVRRLPGVQAAGVTTNTPLSHNAWDAAFECEGRPRSSASEVLLTADRLVSPGYLETIGVTMLRGRTLSPQDTAASQPVAVITESLAETCWPGQDPIGKRVRRISRVLPNHWMTVVGLARDVREDRNAFRRGRPAWYLPFVQTASARPIHLVVRAERDPLALANDIRREVWALDANQPISAPLPLDASVTELVHPDRFAAFVMLFLALVGMLLATIGIFGLVSYVTGQRTREIGIRMAFGAQRADILKMILRQGLGLVLVGVALGGAAAAAVSKLLASFVFDPQRGDLSTIAGVALVLAAVALAACWIPARRATRVDPMVALRYE